MRLQSFFRCASVMVAWTLPVVAQQQSTITKVEFRNAGDFAPAALESVAGIHPGSRASLKDMQAAAQHLADTGFFEDVHLESKGSAQALTLIFVLRPAAQQPLYRVVYDNFVWFSAAELQAAIHGVAPLLSNRLPETDATLDSVSKVLEGAVQGKGYPQAQVTHHIEPASDAVPESLLHFTVEQPAVRVGAVDVQVPAAFADQIGKTELKLRGAHYIAGDLPLSTQGMLLHPLWNAGYLEAHLADSKVTFSSGGATPVQVQMAGRVEQGALYHVASLQFEPTDVVSAQMFAAGQTLHNGDVASLAALYATEAPAERAYRKIGYMYAYVDSGGTLDVQSKTVRYALHMVPGERYTVRGVRVEGLPPQGKAQFDRAWTIKPGDPYDAAKVAEFLKNNSAMQELQGYAGTFQASADVESHQVDLVVQFLKTGSGR